MFEKAVKLAIENGYILKMGLTSNQRYELKRVFEDGNFPGIVWCKFEIFPQDIRGRFQEEITLTTNDIVADAEFWKALSRALGWGSGIKKTKSNNTFNYSQPIIVDAWLNHALRFFEIKLTNGSEETFWKDILGE